MKKILALIAITLLTHAAHAIPVPFEIVGSSLTAVGNGIGVFDYDDNSISETLDDGESAAVTFGTVSALAFSMGSLELTLDFDAPIDSNETQTGDYEVATVLVFNFANVRWDGPLFIDYLYAGNYGTFQITFDDFSSISTGFPSWELTGTITNLGSTPGPAPVPEPGTLALLGLGLLGLRRAHARHRI